MPIAASAESITLVANGLLCCVSAVDFRACPDAVLLVAFCFFFFALDGEGVFVGV